MRDCGEESLGGQKAPRMNLSSLAVFACLHVAKSGEGIRQRERREFHAQCNLTPDEVVDRERTSPVVSRRGGGGVRFFLSTVFARFTAFLLVKHIFCF